MREWAKGNGKDSDTDAHAGAGATEGCLAPTLGGLWAGEALKDSSPWNNPLVGVRKLQDLVTNSQPIQKGYSWGLKHLQAVGAEGNQSMSPQSILLRRKIILSFRRLISSKIRKSSCYLLLFPRRQKINSVLWERWHLRNLQINLTLFVFSSTADWGHCCLTEY